MKKTLARIGMVLAAGYVALVAVYFFAQRGLLYHPSHGVAAPAATVAPEMSVVGLVAEDGVKLSSWYHPAPVGRPTILVFHGNAGNVARLAWRARILLDAGFGVMLLEYRGFGASEGSPSERGFLADGRAAVRYLLGLGIKPANLVLYGNSLGTGVAIAMAAEFEVGAVVLESPYSSITDVAAVHYPFIPFALVGLDHFNSMALIARVRAPIYAYHGTRDTVIPIHIGRRLFDAAPGPKEYKAIQGAGHNTVFRPGVGGALAFLSRVFEPES